MLVFLIAIVFVLASTFTLAHMGKVTVFYLLKHLTIKQMAIAAFALFFFYLATCGRSGIVLTFITVSLFAFLWWFLLKRWTDAIRSGKQDEFLKKAESEYDEFKSYKNSVRMKKDKEMNDLFNKRYNETIHKN